jgi:HlyD family secretion protein
MEWQYYTAVTDEQQTHIDYLEGEYRTTESLYRKLVVPQTEYLQQKNAYESASGQLNNLKEQFSNRWESERTGYELDISEWQSAIRQLEEEKTKYILKAPETGSIIRFAGIREGNFISSGQTIGYISSDSLLLVECYVSPVDIGYIKENQPVSF